MRPARLAALAVLLLALPLAAGAQGAAAPARPGLELELGAGAKIDPYPYGIENVTALAAAGLWLGPGSPLRPGLVAAASGGSAKLDLELAACLRIEPSDRLGLFGGLGAVADSSQSPVLAPMLLAGVRVGARWAIELCGEVHFEPYNEDAMIWIALSRRL